MVSDHVNSIYMIKTQSGWTELRVVLECSQEEDDTSAQPSAFLLWNDRQNWLFIAKTSEIIYSW